MNTVHDARKCERRNDSRGRRTISRSIKRSAALAIMGCICLSLLIEYRFVKQTSAGDVDVGCLIIGSRWAAGVKIE